MKIKIVLNILLALIVVALSNVGIVSAQDAATVFTQQTNPHAVCNFYRSAEANIPTGNGQVLRPVIERETDNECLISLGDGGPKAYTQYYYSGNNWCYKMIQDGQTLLENCIPTPDSAVSIDNIEEYAPYIVGGLVVFGLIAAAGGASANRKSKLAKQNSDPEAVETSETATDEQKAKDTKQFKVIRSGHTGSYGWEEMETETTDTGEDMTKGPGVGQSQGGIGLHQGEPIVAPTTSNVASEIEKLVKLKNKGVISQKEFNIAKHKLLK